MDNIRYFDAGIGQVIGSFYNITEKDTIKSISVDLSRDNSKGRKGRRVTGAYWIIDEEKLSLLQDYFGAYDNLILDLNDAIYCDDATISGSYINLGNEKAIETVDGRKYVNTNVIRNGEINTATFIFNNNTKIESTKIFFALISELDTTTNFGNNSIFPDTSRSLAVKCKSGEGFYSKRGAVTFKIPVKSEPNKSIDCLVSYLNQFPINHKLSCTIHAIHDGDNENTIEPIYCSDLRYRTWSEPKGPMIVTSDLFGDNNSDKKYLYSFIDGGEKWNDVPYTKFNVAIAIDDSNVNFTVNTKTRIINDSEDGFNNDFYLPEGRLADVIFDSPECPAFIPDNSADADTLSQPRWVFKRSRIKFTIPPARDFKHNTYNKDVTIRYRVETPIHDDNYKIEYKECKYSAAEAKNDISLVICPRDEGVLDNMAFKVRLSRKFTNSSNWCEDTIYEFHTYQKPTANIAYPKYTRNDSTDLANGKGFKFPKIITSNMYSNFNGEESIVNKYVCDALNVIIATPQNDNSGIPQFVRFFLSEYRYGRTGLGGVKYGKNGDEKETDNNGELIVTCDWQNADTIQSLYRSNNEDDYASYEDILSGSNKLRTAYVTNIYSNDGNPILISGRFSDTSLSEIGKEFKLWTYNTWDYVDNDNDVEVGNAWRVESSQCDENGVEYRYKYDDNGVLNVQVPSSDANYSTSISKKFSLTPPMIKDHYGAPIEEEWWDKETRTRPKKVKQEVSKAILFRAGYIYLLRIRMFHGAAAGAIGAKYGLKNPMIYGQYGRPKSSIYDGSTSGSYDYANHENYHGAYPYFQFDGGSGLLQDVIYSKDGNINNNQYVFDSDLKEMLTIDDIAIHGDLHPFAKRLYDFENHKVVYEDWYGPDDGTSGLSLNDARLNQTYPGFSEVDYTIIEPVCPYTSKSNLITVHPTCSEIGANQWITFNYRHLAKSLAGIDSYAVGNTPGSGDSNSFGFTNGDCQNTITRIMNMYDACVKYILNKYIEQRNTLYINSGILVPNTCSDCNDSKIIDERISIWIEPLNDRLNTDENSQQYYVSSLRKGKTDSGTDINDVSIPLLLKYQINGINTISNNENIYKNSLKYKCTSDKGIEFECKSGVSYYAHYVENKLNSYKYSDISDSYYLMWPENLIVWKQYQGPKLMGQNVNVDEPFGNVYRWQPIINAMTDNLSELQIEDKCNEFAKNYSKYIDMTNSIQNTNTFKFSNTDKNNIDNNLNNKLNIQTKYAYNDFSYFSTANYPAGSNFENNCNTTNKNTRFSIKEFAGITNTNLNYINTRNNVYNPGYSVMYTTPNYATNNNVVNGFKFFASFLTINNQHGHLYRRVPTIQDCENGLVTAFSYSNTNKGFNGTGLKNIGSLSMNTLDSKNLNKLANKNMNSNNNNDKPLVRTTHYLYFKTWINTTFYVQVEAEAENIYCKGYTTDGDDVTHNGSEIKYNSGLFLFNGDTLTKISESTISTSTDGRNLNNLITEAKNNGIIGRKNGLANNPNNACRIKFGNDNGLSQVYAEDNFGWGRCLSADDISAKIIKYSGNLGTNYSGGIEIPIQVRYTPLLQPKLLSETGINLNKNEDIVLESGNKNITLINSNANESIKVEFANGNSNSNMNTVTMSEFDLNVYYPYIPEDNEYITTNPNGGNDGIQYKDYFYDVDTFPKSTKPEEYVEPKNKDFLGGYGICTGYTVLLVPTNPNTNNLSDFEKQMYFNSTNNHWNFFKQPNNYYKNGDIFNNVMSSIVDTAGTVVVAYNLQTKFDSTHDSLNYTQSIPNSNIPITWRNKIKIFNGESPIIKGRNYQSINFNFKNLCDGLIWYENTQDPIDFDTFKSETGIELTDKNLLNVGVIYDLVIIPTYSNKVVNVHNYIDGAGKLNPTTIPTSAGDISNEINNNYGGGKSEIYNGDKTTNIQLAGSNPLVLYNYLQVSNSIIENTEDDIGGRPPSPLVNRIHESDCAIIFPNVNNVKFNLIDGEIKECPGFWLNNTFRLIVRMPSFRTKSTRYSGRDMYTIENMSHGILNSTNGDTANDFLFDDIQIHIGKIEELEKYGYPDKMHLNLNKLTDKEDLAKAHIISYKWFGKSEQGVFSKKLKNYAGDNRSLLTAGHVDPYEDEYKNRFIEINLSNAQIWSESLNKMVPVYTEYPEGYYIQVRWKSIYAAGTDESQWSNWTGGSSDGGKNWWGNYGTEYYVPIRNYTDIHTDFRNYVKESYPGSLITSNNTEIVGKGSYVQFGDNKSYYNRGLGNKSTSNDVLSKNDTMLVPDNYTINNIENVKILKKSGTKYVTDKTVNLSANHDNPYANEIYYLIQHSSMFTIPENITNMHQNMWEMLYIDYVVRNMCKLYYKENNYDENDTHFVSTAYRKMKYHLSVPFVDNKPISINFKTWGWDDTEYHIFEKSETIKTYKGSDKEQSITEKLVDSSDINADRIKGPNSLDVVDGISLITNRKRWDRNKYYRKPITKQDFDELNSHLIELIKFIRHPSFTGAENMDINDFLRDERLVLPINPNALIFDRSRKSLIGHDTTSQPGLTSINNINHSMMSSNYIQNIWYNILSICKNSELYDDVDVKTFI